MASLLTAIRNLLFGKNKPFLATVAIDLGTTYSGFAYSFNKEEGEDAIFLNRDWVNEQGHRTTKTPTCLLLKPDLSFDSFGYKAVERFAHLRDVYTTWNEFLFFENFKLNMPEEETLDLDINLEASNKKVVRGTTVFAQCFKFLKDEAVDVIRQETGDEGFKVEDIQWVLTVPAMWTPRAKQFMREAAYEAGIGSRDNPGQVLIAFDAEAAALFCSMAKLNDSQDETVTAMGEHNAQYVVADLGGGSLNVTAIENQLDGGVHIIYKNTSEPFDEVMVNCQFENLLDELFGAQKMFDYRQLFPADWLKMMHNFEAKTYAFQKRETKIRLTGSFVSWVNDFRSPSMKRFAEGEVRIIDDEYLWVSPRVMLRLFQPLLEAIKDHLRDTVLNKPRLSKLTTFLVGGLADSPLIQQEIKNVFSGRCCVITPREAIIAIVHGAVIFGKRAAAENKRVVAGTYGADCSRRFVQGVHPEEKKFIAAGQEKCKDLFNCFVKENDTIKRRQKISITYRPRDPNETEVRYSFYAADTPDVMIVTEPGATNIGSVVLQSPDTLKGLDRDIEVSLYFAGTDVIATAWDVTSGNTAQTTLDVYPSPCKPA